MLVTQSTNCLLGEISIRAPNHVGSVYYNYFAVKGPRLWNMLPKDLTLADSLLKFFKTNLYILLSFKVIPPISGDETQIPNSVTHC